MQKKWFISTLFFSVLAILLISLNAQVKTALAFYQVNINGTISCCSSNFLACLDVEAKKVINPVTAQYFTSYTAMGFYDFDHGSHYQVEIDNLCYGPTKSNCFPKTTSTCEAAAPDQCLIDSDCPTPTTQFCDISPQPNVCLAKKSNDQSCQKNKHNQCASGYCKPATMGSGGFCAPATCTQFTYTAWTPCGGGQQLRTIKTKLPAGCINGNPAPLVQACGAGVQCSSWTYGSWGQCSGGKQQRTVATSLPQGCIGGTPIIEQPCGEGVVACTAWTYSGWGDCVENKKHRTVATSLPQGCTGEPPADQLTLACGPGIAACASFTYSTWAACNNGQQIRTVATKTPANCVGGDPVLSQPCTITCTLFTYSPWTTCANGQQTRTILTKLPATCTGGTPEASSKNCAAAPTTCSPACTADKYCDGAACVDKKANDLACSGGYQCNNGFCYNSLCSGAADSDCPSLTQPNCSGACYWVSGACSSKAKYGDTCTATSDCKEGNCIADGGSSVCRKVCTGTDCPDGNFCFDAGGGNKFCKTKQAEGGTCAGSDGSSCISGICEAGKCKGSTAPVTAAGGTTPASSEFTLPNFLGVDDPNVVVGRIIKYIIGFTGTIALLAFMYGGSLWLISAGRPDYVTKGKNYMIWAAVGLALVFGSYIIVGQIFTLFGQ